MNETKRQQLPTGLWVVATPIGNLADLAPRARMALEQADAVLCEDTRRTAQLLAAVGLGGQGKHGTSLERLDAHASPARVEAMVRRLREGQSLALVTDGGTPGVSDPGSALVAKARAAGILVTPIAGPSAITALLSVCGFSETSFSFRGFFPRKKSDAIEEITVALASKTPGIFIWFESPKRMAETMGFFAEETSQVEMVVAKELTKLHEKIFSGLASVVSEEVTRELKSVGELGEWCFAVRAPGISKKLEESSDWVKVLECLIDAGVSASEAARQTSQHFGAPRKKSYETALRLSGKK